MKDSHFSGASRRAFLIRSLAGSLACSTGALAILGLPRSMLAAQAQAPDIIEVSGSMHLVRGLGGNVFTFSTGDGMVLVDSGAAQATAALTQALAGLAGSDNVHTLFNTHWHPDQVGGNAWFGERGADIIAHKNTLLHLKTPYYLFDEQRYTEPMPAPAWPGQTFYETGTVSLGGESIDYGYLEMAHTNGDIYVRFNNANVMVVGDVVSPAIDPAFDWFSGGWIGGRVDALNHLLDKCDAQTAIIPAYGPVIGRAHVEAERDLMQFLYDTLVDQIRMGFDYKDSLASGVMDNLPRKLDDPARFLYDAHKGLWAHHNKLEPNIV